MTALKIMDVKNFMEQLLLKETFDNFLVSETEITTANTYKINGRLCREWFDEAEREELGEREYARWSELKAILHRMVRGNKPPQSMKLVLLLNPENVRRVVERAGSGFTPRDVDGIFLNIRFEKGELILVTGTSMNTFTLNKALEQEWDESMKQYLRHFGILFEEQ